MLNDAAYWISLAHISYWRSRERGSAKSKWGNQKIVELIIKFHSEKKLSIQEFFALAESDLVSEFGFSQEQLLDFFAAKQELTANAFLSEQLQRDGIEILPITDPRFSPIAKTNMKRNTPPVIYTKGNLGLLQEKSIAVVGSRKAIDVSLNFTDDIVKQESKLFKVIVSGFAKGVDQKALDSAMEHNGNSIIVLPQGISTFNSGFKRYYAHLVEGKVLVMSTFFPKAPWSVQLAMARNPVIYGFAETIFVAESAEKGGTWSGVIDGLKKKQKIVIRKPQAGEPNFKPMSDLIAKGAIPVDYPFTKENYHQLSVKEEMLVSEATLADSTIPEWQRNIDEEKIPERIPTPQQGELFDGEDSLKKDQQKKSVKKKTAGKKTKTKK